MVSADRPASYQSKPSIIAMKKITTRFFSALAIAATVFSSSAAPQMAKKLSGAPASKATVTQKAEAKPATVNKRFHVATTRKANPTTFSAFRSAAKGGLKLKQGQGPLKVLAEGANLPEIIGSVVYNVDFSSSSAAYLANVSTTVPTLLFEGPDASAGGVCVEDVYYSTSYFSFWGMIFATLTATSVENGEILATIDVSDNFESLAIGGTVLDPTTGDVYGITYNAEGSGLQLTKLVYSTAGVTTTKIADLDGNWNSIVCDAAGQLYGISYTGTADADGNFLVNASYLNKIDKATGAVTLIGETGQLPQYLSSAAIDPKTGRMFWDVCPPDETSLLCEVNLTTGQATILFEYTKADEIMGMYVPQPAAEDGAPASVTGLEASFPEGSMSGIVSFSAPTTLFDGTAATGDLTYEILANGESVATGDTSYGATVNAPITLTEAAEYTFTVTVSNSVGKSPKAKVTLFVGKGTPKAPTATLTYTDGTMKLDWEPITTTIDGGYMNPAAVTYKVTRYPGAVVVEEATTATTFSEAIAEPTVLTEYYYTVVATADGVTSAEGKSNIVALGAIVPPYTNNFDSADDLAGYGIIDANGDGKTWTFNNGAVRVTYNSSADMDDWLITPPLKLEVGKIYEVSFKTYGQSAAYQERIEVKYGTQPTVAGLDQVLVEPTDLTTTSEEPVVISEYLVPTATGNYYIGFHGISDADKYYLYVDEISVGAPTYASAPGVATDIVITPDAAGALKANVAFKAPALDFAGNALSSLTKVEVSRQGEVVKTFENPAVGESLSFDDVLLEGGDVEYSFQGFNADGAGKVATASAFIGFDAPQAPANVQMVETSTLGQVTITWDAVTEDVNGKPLSAADVEYVVTDDEGNPVSEFMTETTFTIQAAAAGEQVFAQYAVFALTNGGQNYTFTDMIAVGTPYAGMTESFANGTLSYILGLYYPVPDNRGSWNVNTDESLDGVAGADGDNGYIAMLGQYLDTTAAIFTGKISLEGMANPGISLYTYNIGGDDINEIQLAVKEPTDADWTPLGAPIVISELSGLEGWNLATASLAQYAGKVIQVSIQATTKQYQYTMLDNIKIGNLAGQDLAASAINAPAKVNAGETYKVDVTVANEGMQESTAASVVLYAGAEPVDTIALEAIASGAKATVSFERTMGAVETTPVDYYAVVEYEADENPDNNTTETVSVSPKYSSLPKVSDLAGEDTSNGVKLTWSEPDLTNVGEAKVVDFEDATAWDFEYDGWTFIDKDESPVGGFQNMELPGITVGQTTGSFFVFDVPSSGGNQTFDAHSGNIYIASLFRYDDGQVDDWAISPELDGTAQTITFWAKSYSTQYPESIEMLYSTGSTETTEFVKVTEAKPVAGDWTEYTFDVPEGAKYFAIRSCATSSFMLMLDDFEFTAASSSADLSIVGYDVYRDGVKITTEPTAECEYVDEDAAEGEHTYVVVTVYSTGTSAPSNAVTLAVSSGVADALAGALTITAEDGVITVAGAEGKLVTVVALDGKVIYCAEGDAKVAVAAGVYVVKADKTVVKVLVK